MASSEHETKINDSPLQKDYDKTETTKIIKKGAQRTDKKVSHSLRNNISFVLLGTCVYFQENYYTSMIMNFVSPDKVGTSIVFLFWPMVVVKLFLLNFVKNISVKTRILMIGAGFFLSSLLLSIIIKKEVDRNTITVPIFYAISAVAMALGEVSVLENAGKYQRSCAASFSTGHGLAGLAAGVTALLMKSIGFIEPKKYAIPAIAIGPFIIFVQFILLGPEKVDISINNKQPNDQNNDQKSNLKVKLKYSVWQMLKILFFGDMKLLSWTFFADYFLYYAIFSGILPVAKEVLKATDPSYSKPDNKFFEFAFLYIKIAVFFCKLVPYFFTFYNVGFIPLVHIISAIIMSLVIKYKINPYGILALSAIVGLGHGFAGAFIIVCVRKKIDERWVPFGLKYITVASSFGAMFGNIFSRLLIFILNLMVQDILPKK